MHKLLRLTIVFLLSSLGHTSDISKRDNVTTLKAPLVAVPSQHWEGVDGTWSTFEIRVGTPGTVFRVLPATSWQETWVVYGAAKDVCNTSVGVSLNCQDARGGVYDSAGSSTWSKSDQYELGLNSALGYNGVGQYGFDTVGLGYTNNTGPTLTHQIVSEIVSDSWWFGMLGLGFQPTNFTGYGDPQASFADTLYSNGSISSMSWSYTAGAYYRLKGIFGSLIFGGYDASRFTPNNVIFTMTGDNLRDIVVTLRTINLTSSTGQTTLMSTPEFAFIDSSVPELWLPVSVCQAFEKALNITLDNSTGRYLIDSSVHASLLALNPNITITLANQKQGGATTDIVLPYAAFNLNVSSPILANRTSFYFPIRQGADDTQYTLGRTFLQEAYVTTHYESRTFNVSQSIFDDTAKPHIIALPPVLATSSSSSNSTGSGSVPKTSKLSKGAIAGIVVGVCCLALLSLLFSAVFLTRRRRKTLKKHNGESTISELAGNPHASQSQGQIDEVDGHDSKFEKFGNPIMIPQELEAEPVPRPARGAKTPMAEIGQDEGGLSAVSEDGHTDAGGHIVSPEGTFSSTFSSRNARTKPAVVVGSPTAGTASTGSSPTSLKRRGSRFEEHLGDM